MASLINKLQEPGIDIRRLLDRAIKLPDNFSVYYNPDKIEDAVFLDGDKYVNFNGQPIRVRRCSANEFVRILKSKLNKIEDNQKTLF